MAKKTSADLADVQATRNGVSRTFNRQTWDLLGPTKQGWEEVKGKPKELETQTDKGGDKTGGKTPIQQKLADAKGGDADAKAKEELAALRATYKEVTGKNNGNTMGKEKLEAAIADAKTKVKDANTDKGGDKTPEELAALAAGNGGGDE